MTYHDHCYCILPSLLLNTTLQLRYRYAYTISVDDVRRVRSSVKHCTTNSIMYVSSVCTYIQLNYSRSVRTKTVHDPHSQVTRIPIIENARTYIIMWYASPIEG